ncbi:MAG: MltA domain-containing protein [Methyloceanibacter sp.]|jgi:membrane-bound lytic murein transglycosylase A|nr:MltA domain-containing protein [Methyloceanibacter sp.]
MGDAPIGYQSIDFSSLSAWTRDDDHAAAFRAFLNSCRKHAVANTVTGAPPCAEALAMGSDLDAGAARNFFESHFTLYCLNKSSTQPSFVTGYYEPELRGARTWGGRFRIPVYGLPNDLASVVPDLYRASYNDRVTGMRMNVDELVPYFTREEIEAGALAGRGLELLYVEDMVELFYIQVQGSGLVHLEDGSRVRLTYAGKNGHPYTSIGKLLIERGEVAAEAMSMDAVKAWLHADRRRGRALMAENKSYVFFRELDAEEGRDGPLGAEGVPLTPERSLAVDPSVIPLGSPILVVADNLSNSGDQHFVRLMIAQDVGSAIKGVGRGDIFWGTGEAAGAIAGRTRHLAWFFLLLPNR